MDNLIIIHDTSTQCSMIFDLKYATTSSSSTKSDDTKKRIPVVNPLMIGMDITKTVRISHSITLVYNNTNDDNFIHTGILRESLDKT